VAALREAEGAVPKDQESGRSPLWLEVGSVAQVVRAQVARSAVLFREQHPVDPMPGVPRVGRLGVPWGPPHRPRVLPGESARVRPPGPLARVFRRRRPRALQSPQALESPVERSRQARPNRAPAPGKLLERRAAPRRAPRRRVADQRKRVQPAAARVPAPREGLSHAERAVRAPVRRDAPEGRFFCPRAQCPRRGYSQVTALFPEYYCRYRCGFSLTHLSED
jgi:hypothetical protein